jgi:hypothetical protein
LEIIHVFLIKLIMLFPHQAGIKSATYSALNIAQRTRVFSHCRSLATDASVENDDEDWIPLMSLSPQDCKELAPVDVEGVARMSLGMRNIDLSFTDIAPKAFLQIRHAAGISSREYADVLGEVECFCWMLAEHDFSQGEATFIWTGTKKRCWWRL